MTATEPGPNCPLCPRLVAFREEWRAKEPTWHNAPVPNFGDPDAKLLIVGLAPGLRGANRTGRPFTGDYAGDLLFKTMITFGFAAGHYGGHRRDGLKLIHALIVNAVRCVPPQNKPLPIEINTCRQFLTAGIESIPGLEAILCLGRISHESTVKALGLRAKDAPFSHGAIHEVRPGLTLHDSYHCSRYNTNTGVLTEEMFRAVFAAIRDRLG